MLKQIFAPQLVVLYAFVASTLYVHFRGRHRLRFARQIGMDPKLGMANLAGHPVRLEQLADVAWPENDWHPIGPDDVGEERIVVYRYERTDLPEATPPATGGDSPRG